MLRRPPRSTLFPSPTLFRAALQESGLLGPGAGLFAMVDAPHLPQVPAGPQRIRLLAAACAAAVALGLALAWLLEMRSAEHTSELQSRQYLVCRLLLEKKIER